MQITLEELAKLPRVVAYKGVECGEVALSQAGPLYYECDCCGGFDVEEDGTGGYICPDCRIKIIKASDISCFVCAENAVNGDDADGAIEGDAFLCPICNELIWDTEYDIKEHFESSLGQFRHEKANSIPPIRQIA
jgi:hypothetical protein